MKTASELKHLLDLNLKRWDDAFSEIREHRTEAIDLIQAGNSIASPAIHRTSRRLKQAEMKLNLAQSEYEILFDKWAEANAPLKAKTETLIE